MNRPPTIRLTVRVPDLPAFSESVSRLPSEEAERMFSDLVVKGPEPAAEDSSPAYDLGGIDPRESGPVSVHCNLRGVVGLPLRLALTFSHRMQGDAEKLCSLSPEVAGRWCWEGERRLVFDPIDGRFPGATEFQVTVARGAQSSSGTTLPRTRRWHFRTAPAAMLECTRQDRSLLLMFDQRVCSRTLLPFVRVTTAGGGPMALVSARSNHCGDAAAYELLGDLLPGPMNVVVRPGAPSQEGPCCTTRQQRRTLLVEQPFKLVRSFFSRRTRSGRARMGSPWVLEFTAAVEANCPFSELITVEPELDEMHVVPVGERLYIAGSPRPGTTYRVRVGSDLKDQQGRKLTGPVERSFVVPRLQRQVWTPRNRMVMLDIQSGPLFPVTTLNAKNVSMAVRRVGMVDLPDFLRPGLNDQPPGTLLAETEIALAPGHGRPLLTWLDLKPYAGSGHLLIRIEDGKRGSRWQWIQATDLSLHCIADSHQLLVWVTSLTTGQACAAVQVTLVRQGPEGAHEFGSGTTDGDGLAALAYPAASESYHDYYLLVRSGADFAVLPVDSHGVEWEAKKWRRSEGELQWHVVMACRSYQPGQDVHLKGWLRVFSEARLETPGALESLQWRLEDHGEVVERGVCRVSAEGGFTLYFRSPSGSRAPGRMPPGARGVTVTLEAVGWPGSGRTRRVPVPTVIVEPATFIPHVEVPQQVIMGDRFTLAALALDRTGSPLAGAAVRWQLGLIRAYHSLRERSAFRFNEWEEGTKCGETLERQGQLDASGRHVLEATVTSDVEHPLRCFAWASVRDEAGRDVRAHDSFMVLPARCCVGLRADWTDEHPEVAVLVCDPEGNVLANRYVEVILEQAGTALQTWTVCSGEDPIGVRLPPVSQWTAVVASVTDEEGRRHRFSLRSRDWGLEDGHTKEHVKISVLPAHTVPDGRVELLLTVPFWPAVGICYVTADGLRSLASFAVSAPQTSLMLAMPGGTVTRACITVRITGESGQHAYGGADVNIDAPSRHLVVKLQAPEEAAPGSEMDIRVEVTDPSGNGVEGAEVCLWVVDEALAPTHGLDLVPAFYRYTDTSIFSANSRVMTVKPERVSLGFIGGCRIADDGIDYAPEEVRGCPPPRIELRRDFNPVPTFIPGEQTGSDGQLRLHVKLSDRVTRFKLHAIAVRGAAFGSSSASTVARLPLTVRAALPSYLTLGDRCEVPLVVDNRLAATAAIRVAARASEGLGISTVGVETRLTGSSRFVHDFPVIATRPGRGTLSVVVLGTSGGDAIETHIRVRPAELPTRELFTGVLRNGEAVLHLAAPEGARAHLSMSPSVHDLVGGAIQMLADYPYDCSEQIASRLLVCTRAMQDRPDLLPPQIGSDGLKERLRRDIERLLRRQRRDGGFSLWDQMEGSSWPLVDVHVCQALSSAMNVGLPAYPEGTRYALERTSKRLQMLLAHRVAGGPAARALLQLRRMHLIDHMPPIDPGALTMAGLVWSLPELFRAGDGMAWIGRVLAAVREGPHLVRLAVPVRGGRALNRMHEEALQGCLLEALAVDGMQSGLTDKVALGLLSGCRTGAWSNTFQNCYAILGLLAWLPDQRQPDPVHLEASLKGGTDAVRLSVPALPGGCRFQMKGYGRLHLRQTGPGWVTYRLDLEQNAPAEASYDSLVVQRYYVAENEANEVTREADGTWATRMSVLVRVEIVVAAPRGGEQVVIIDPLPAGLEPVRLIGGRSDVAAFEIMRGEVRLFVTSLNRGSQRFAYVCRAIRRGLFKAPPCKVEEMYDPSVRGSSQVQALRID
ncbi:MAG: Ig-like domain-containing alpha-2-macroglobulin family protein [Candidatus Xenobia bacterium]